MKVMFIGTTGVHHTLVAANLLSDGGVKGKYSRLENFADSSLDRSGYPLLIYDDNRGGKIYTLGVGKNIDVATKAINEFIELLGFKSADLLIKPVEIRGGSFLLWLGKKIPQAVLGKSLSSFLAEKIIKWQFKEIRRCVEEVKGEIQKTSQLAAGK